ncbi:hypothetical protein I8U17_05135 [Thermoactinomyces sp. CICC 10521]|nr:hypothetical protein [Thermoactinomyces sp. CICC 10521]
MAYGKKILTPKTDIEIKEVKESTTDPESGYFVKNERQRIFTYSFHTGFDRNCFVSGAIVEQVMSMISGVFHLFMNGSKQLLLSEQLLLMMLVIKLLSRHMKKISRVNQKKESRQETACDLAKSKYGIEIRFREE